MDGVDRREHARQVRGRDLEHGQPRAVERSLEERLEALLGQIEGAGQVSVLLTEKEGSQTLYQTDSQTDADDSGSRRTDDTVLIEDENRTESGLVRQTLGPVYRGAVVLCQGADDPSVKLAVVEAVRCVTGLGADQISVQKMK
jgi:stage III sporulation protein AG